MQNQDLRANPPQSPFDKGGSRKPNQLGG